MNNPPDRVWLACDANGEVRFVADEPFAARAEAASWDKDCPSSAPHVVHAYHLHRPKLIERAPEMDAALRDCLALAVRHRHEEWAQHVMKFCARGGVVPSPLRGE
jgi:hypothetical protein